MRRIWFIGFLAACAGTPEKEVDTAAEREQSLRLRWVKASADESWDQAQGGLLWALSLLGAVPLETEPGLDVISEGAEQAEFELDLHRLGLTADALTVLHDAVEPLRASDEMAVVGSVDVGRFLMHTLYSPSVYYGVTGACSTHVEWTEKHLAEPSGTHWVSDSLLTEEHRLVRFNMDVPGVGEIALDVTEGTHGLAADVIDVMPNGQQRFSAYGKEGQLVGFSPSGGSPGRCMWCHEGHMQRGTAGNVATGDHMGHEAFVVQLEMMEERMAEAREASGSAVDFETYHVHTWGEVLVEWFLQAPAERLAREWGVSEDEVRQKVLDAGMEWTSSEEYPSLGPVLPRAEADRLMLEVAGYSPLEVTDSAREVFGSLDDVAYGACR